MAPENAPILFEETQVDLGELMKEIAAPGLCRNFKLPTHVAVELRRHQIRRLEENIALLRKKQEEFHSKMEEYVTSLRALIQNLQAGLGEDANADGPRAPRSNGTHVRCIGCGSEQVFADLDVLFAREPDDMFTAPIEVIVHQEGKLKKGVFRCPRCGDCNLSIKPR